AVAWGPAEPALVSDGVQQHWGRDFAGNAAAAGAGIAAGRGGGTYHRSTQPLLVGIVAAEPGRSRRAGKPAVTQAYCQADSGRDSEVMDAAADVVGSGGHAE